MYHIIWEIDLEADSPKEAAEKALAIQRDRTSCATIFDVYDESCEKVTVDLLMEALTDAPTN